MNGGCKRGQRVSASRILPDPSVIRKREGNEVAHVDELLLAGKGQTQQVYLSFLLRVETFQEFHEAVREGCAVAGQTAASERIISRAVLAGLGLSLRPHPDQRAWLFHMNAAMPQTDRWETDGQHGSRFLTAAMGASSEDVQKVNLPFFLNHVGSGSLLEPGACPVTAVTHPVSSLTRLT